MRSRAAARSRAGRVWPSASARTSMSTVRLRLAEALAVPSVTSVEYGRLLHLRIRGQNTVLVNLPRIVPQDSDLTLIVTYDGPNAIAGPRRRHGVALDRTPRNRTRQPISPDPALSAQQPRVLVSAEPGAGLRDRDDAHHRAQGYRASRAGNPLPPVARRVAARHPAPGRKVARFVFRADQPLRYLALVVSRFARVGESKVAMTNQVGRGLRRRHRRGQRRGAEQPSRTGTAGRHSRPKSILRFYSIARWATRRTRR